MLRLLILLAFVATGCSSGMRDRAAVTPTAAGAAIRDVQSPPDGCSPVGVTVKQVGANFRGLEHNTQLGMTRARDALAERGATHAVWSPLQFINRAPWGGRGVCKNCVVVTAQGYRCAVVPPPAPQPRPVLQQPQPVLQPAPDPVYAPLPQRSSRPVNGKTDKINVRCADKWADNYRMQKYCRKQESKGASGVLKFYKKHSLDKEENLTSPYGKIFGKCMDKWTDKFGPAWRMTDYCIRKQADAYKDLQK